jgi:hypothetical protein
VSNDGGRLGWALCFLALFGAQNNKTLFLTRRRGRLLRRVLVLARR